ncbi:MAG: hypothetical protein NVS9B6_03020 [Candidatus Limnocylindrales bacterium]
MDVYDALRERLDYASFVPTPRPDIVRSELRRRDGSPYTMLKNPAGDGGAGSYLRVEPADVALLDLMDGRRSVQEVLVTHLERSGVFALDRLSRLTAALRANGFFGEAPPPLYEKLRARRARRDPIVRASRLLQRLVLWDLAHWSNAHRFVDLLYRSGGKLAFTRAGAVLLIAFSVAGLGVWLSELLATRHQLVTLGGSYVFGILALVLLQVLSITIHEAGHALAIRHFGRHIRRCGVAMYYLFPCFYVDSTDMSLGSRRERVIVSLAGPFGGLSVGAACALVAAADPGGVVGGIAFKAASLFVFQFVLNLLPILELDGYHVLVDALEAPFLRQRALGFVRGPALRKLRRRQRWSREEIGLAIFGASAILVSLVTLLFSIVLWRSRIAVAARELLAVGPVGLLALAILVLVFVGPLAIAVVGRVLGIARTAARLANARRARVVARELDERAALLGRVRFFAGLGRPALNAIASHLRIEHADPGSPIVTAGAPGDRFYLVRSGRLQTTDASGRILGTIIPGEGFGELALLEGGVRTATVTALEPAELWSLGRGHFNRWVKERVEVAARIRAYREERDTLGRLPFFKGLSGQALERVAARLRTIRYADGEQVFGAGDPADRYYVIREGAATVTLPDGTLARTLGPGDGFGEIALLFGRPRTATVRAAGPLTVAALERADFASLVKTSGETMGEFRTRTGHYVGAHLGAAVGGG